MKSAWRQILCGALAGCGLVGVCEPSAAQGPPRREVQARTGPGRVGLVGSRNLGPVAERIRHGRCQLLLVGDSIATHLAMGDRGTWVTGIWRTWHPDSWRGRFVPAVTHGDLVNGTRIQNGGQAPGFDPACEPIHPGLPAHPGESMSPFESGWWSIPVHGFLTTGDLEPRNLYRFEIPAEIDGRDLLARYRSDPDWLTGPLRATSLLVVEPDSLEEVRFRSQTADGTWTIPVDLDLGEQLPDIGTDLLGVSYDFEESGRGGLAIEMRTTPDHVEQPGRSLACLGLLLERRDRATGLLLGSTSCGGDTTRAHLEVGEAINTEGVDVHRFYDDDYLRRFIETAGWNTFVITLGTNDLNAKFREPAEVVTDLQAVIDRYRRIALEAAVNRPDLEPPLFLVVSPTTAYADENHPRFAALDAQVGVLAGDDVAVVHLHALFHERFGQWSGYESQLLVDGTHPNDVGSMVLADLVWNEILAATDADDAASDPLRLVPTEYETLAAATNGTVDEDIVLLGPGDHPGGATILSDGVVICSSHGLEATGLLGSSMTRCLTVAAPGDTETVIRGLTLRDGHASRGGGVLIDGGSVRIRNCRIADCHATERGGGIAISEGTLVIEASDLEGCASDGDGGGIHAAGAELLIRASRVADCVATVGGGGLGAMASSVVHVDDTHILGNSSQVGGGIHAAGELDILDGVIEGNTSIGDGGGVLATGPLELRGTVLRLNQAGGNGGAIRIDADVDSMITEAELEENGALGRGGGLSIAGAGTCSVSLSRFGLHRAEVSGGAVHLDCADAVIASTEFEAGSAPTCAAVDAWCGDLLLSGCSVCLDGGEICGDVRDGGGNEYEVPCTGICLGDLDLDGAIDGGDLGLLFAAWGPCQPSSYCRADLNRDGLVSGLDLGLLLSALGSGGTCD